MAQHGLSRAAPSPEARTAEADVTGFLRDMFRVNRAIAHLLNPALEQNLGIDGRLALLLKRIEAGDVHPGALAESTRLPKSLISRHIDQLAKKGLLVRRLEAGDSRRIRLILTKTGERVLVEANALTTELVGSHLNRIPEKEREIVLSALGDLARYME